MIKIKRMFSMVLCLILILTIFNINVGAVENLNEAVNGTYAVYAGSSFKVEGGATRYSSNVVGGNVYVKDGILDLHMGTSVDHENNIYIGANVEKKLQWDYENNSPKDQIVQAIDKYVDYLPYTEEVKVPVGLPNKGSEWLGNMTITESCYYDTFTIGWGNTLVFDTGDGNVIDFVVGGEYWGSLNINGGGEGIVVKGTGKVNIYLANGANTISGGNININGSSEQVNIYFTNPNAYYSVVGVNGNANFYYPSGNNGNLKFNSNVDVCGNVYANGAVEFESNCVFTGMVYNPTGDVKVVNDATIKGFVVGDNVFLCGSGRIIYGEISSNIPNIIVPSNGNNESNDEDNNVEATDIVGEGRVISTKDIVKIGNDIDINLRFGTGLANYKVWISGKVGENCDGLNIQVISYGDDETCTNEISNSKAYINKEKGVWSVQASLEEAYEAKNYIKVIVTNSNGDSLSTTYRYWSIFPDLSNIEELDETTVINVEKTTVKEYVHKDIPKGKVLVKGSYSHPYDVKPEIYVNGVEASVARMNDETVIEGYDYNSFGWRTEENEFWAVLDMEPGIMSFEVTTIDCFGKQASYKLEDVLFYNDINNADASNLTIETESLSEDKLTSYVTGYISDINDFTNKEVIINDNIKAHVKYNEEKGMYRWSANVPLQDGKLIVNAKSVNIYGKVAEANLEKVYYNSNNPKPSILSDVRAGSRKSDGMATIAGNIKDDNDFTLKKVTVNGVEAHVSKSTGDFSVRLEVVPGVNVFVVESTNIFGLTVREVISRSY